MYVKIVDSVSLLIYVFVCAHAGCSRYELIWFFLFLGIQSRFALQNLHGKCGVDRDVAVRALVLLRRVCLVRDELPDLQGGIQRIRACVPELMEWKKEGYSIGKYCRYHVLHVHCRNCHTQKQNPLN